MVGKAGMAVQCSRCGNHYDVTLFQFGRKVICDCGAAVAIDRSQRENASELLVEDRAGAEELRGMADKVCYLILNTDYPRIDVEIAAGEIKARCQELFPDKTGLYGMIYESRFQRLWEQFREK